MNYVYDISLNLNKDYIDFYDWNENDDIIYFIKIPIIKISNYIQKIFKMQKFTDFYIILEILLYFVIYFFVIYYLINLDEKNKRILSTFITINLCWTIDSKWNKSCG